MVDRKEDKTSICDNYIKLKKGNMGQTKKHHGH
jgi:hypothetical protein